MNRRTLLTGAAGCAAVALVGCGGDREYLIGAVVGRYLPGEAGLVGWVLAVEHDSFENGGKETTYAEVDQETYRAISVADVVTLARDGSNDLWQVAA